MTTFLVTVDTEHFTQAPSPVAAYPGGAWCTIGGRHCGFPLIMELCDKHAIKATFFVNVFEECRIGEAVMARMCKEIMDRGHDVQLHTHPAFLTGRPLLADHSRDEQRELVAIGKRKLYAWTGRHAVAHRAGYYGINDDSLAALKDCDIALDCSAFFQRKGCRVQWSRWELTERNGMWELPISWFRVNGSEPIRAGGSGTGRVCKVDIDKASADGLIAFLRYAEAEGYGHVTLASHSFSLIQKRASGEGYLADERKIRELNRVLGYVNSSPSLETQAVADLWDDIGNGRVASKPDGKEICLDSA